MIAEYLRLALATAVLLLPGALVARAVGRSTVSETLAWSLASVFAALTVVFALHTALAAALVVLAAVAVAALPFALRTRRRPAAVRTTALAALAGLAFGLLLWRVSPPLGGDALFHLARVRKLDALGDLHLRSVDEFRDGGLHPGYAFPLWHGFLALVARLSGLDVTTVVRHEASVLAPLAFAVVYEAGYAVFRSASAAAAVVVAQISLTALAPGHGGAFTALALPPTASRQLIAPAVVALFFLALDDDEPWRLQAGIAAGSLALVLVHPTYALFLALPLGGFLVARWLLDRSDALRAAAGLLALAAPTAAAVAWLRPVVNETVSHDPSRAERARSLAHYGNQLDVWSVDRYRLAPEAIARSGAVAVAALVLVPLAFFAARRRWGALVLGGSLVLLALMLVPALFTRLSDVVSLSQARRAAGFLPLAFAFAGGLAVLAGRLRLLLVPAALVAGIVAQHRWPGDFVYGLGRGGPALAVWIAVVGGSAALLLAVVLRPRVLAEGAPALAAVAFCVPVAVSGFSHWTPRASADSAELSPGLVRALRADVPKGAVVFSDTGTSYAIAALAPVYVAAAPVAHVADTTANRPYARRRDVLAFARTRDLAIPRRYGAGWIVLDRRAMPFSLPLPQAYRDGRFTLYRLPGGAASGAGVAAAAQQYHRRS